MAKGLQDQDRAQGRRVCIICSCLQMHTSPWPCRRARYLRLPSAASRQVPEHPRASAYPARMRSTSPTLVSATAPSDAPVALSKPFALKPGIASLLSTRPKLPDRPSGRARDKPTAGSPRPKLSTRASTARGTSPTRSQVSSHELEKAADGPQSRTRPRSTRSGGDMGRSSLWQELRDMQLRSRPFSDRSLSREPP